MVWQRLLRFSLVQYIAARALATHLIPGCVGRGVRLGSESSSGGAGGVWKSGNLEIQKFEDPGTWKCRNWGSKKSKKIESLKIKIRSAQNVGKTWNSGKKSLEGPIWGHLRPFFPWTEKNQKMYVFAYVPWWGPCCYPPGVGQ